jgi:hypothetical protein
VGVRKRVAFWRVPLSITNTVEPKKPHIGAQPEVTISVLSYRNDLGWREPFLNPPGGVSILTHLECRVQTEHTLAPAQQKS